MATLNFNCEEPPFYDEPSCYVEESGSRFDDCEEDFTPSHVFLSCKNAQLEAELMAARHLITELQEALFDETQRSTMLEEWVAAAGMVPPCTWSSDASPLKGAAPISKHQPFKTGSSRMTSINRASSKASSSWTDYLVNAAVCTASVPVALALCSLALGVGVGSVMVRRVHAKRF